VKKFNTLFLRYFLFGGQIFGGLALVLSMCNRFIEHTKFQFIIFFFVNSYESFHSNCCRIEGFLVDAFNVIQHQFKNAYANQPRSNALYTYASEKLSKFSFA